MRRASEMSNPIRIAQGPPTEEGNYLYQMKHMVKRNEWAPIKIVNERGRLVCFGTRHPVAEITHSRIIRWSTRIPDPEKME